MREVGLARDGTYEREAVQVREEVLDALPYPVLLKYFIILEAAFTRLLGF
jgi:hypothetical protein